MNRNYERTIGTALYLIDVTMLCAVFYAVWERVYNPQLSRLFYWRGNVFLVALYAIMLLLSFSMLNGDRPGETRLLETIASQTIGVLITDFAAYLILMIVFHGLLNPRPVAVMAGMQIVILFFWDWIAHRIYVHYVPPQQLLMVYDRMTDPALALKLSGAASRYVVAASIGVEQGREAIKALLPEYDAVLVALWDDQWRGWLMRQCLKRNISMLLRPTVTDVVISGMQEKHPIDTVLLQSTDHRLSLDQRFLKRTLDIVLSAIGIVLASPIMLAAAIAIKLDDGGPVFFRQERLTRDAARFRVIKFRSMVPDAEKNGQRWASEDDDRITRVGRFLRKTRLDELPQLFNVLRGDMSLVGPRPETPALTESFLEDVPEFVYRLKVKAGITGYAQVYGNYSTEPADKLLMDIMYIERYSLLLDIRLILLTVRAVLMTEKTDGVKKDSETKATVKQG